MELFYVIIVAILLTAMCIGCFILGYKVCDKVHAKEAKRKEEEQKEYEDQVQLTEGNKQYFRDLANVMGYQGKEMSTDDSEE